MLDFHPKAEAIAVALRGRRTGSTSWSCHCPAHDDKTPSLAITAGDNGKVLAHCHAGCSQSDVIDALRKRGLWSENSEKAGVGAIMSLKPAEACVVPVPGDAPPPPATHFSRGQPTMVWTYRDALGSVLGYVARFDDADGGKDILPLNLWRDAVGVSRWRWKAGPEPRPLYGLDRLAAMPNSPVLVVEGEKTADAAAAMFPDYVVISSPGGAAAAAKADWTPTKGRKLTVWGDADSAGQVYAAKVAGLAHAAGAISVTMVNVPVEFYATKKGWDLADVPPPGWTPARLRTLVAEATPAVTITEAKPVEGVALTNAGNMTPEAQDWVWGGWLASGRLQVIAGAPGTGKTTISLAIAAAVTAGGFFPDGQRAQQGSVMVWSGEDGLADALLPRFLANGGDQKRLYFVSNRTTAGETRPFDPATDMKALAEAASGIPDLKLVILDPIVSAVAGDSHKNTEVRRALAGVTRLGEQTGAAILGVTHFSKGSAKGDPVDRVTGSIAFAALPRVVLCTSKGNGEGAPRRLVRAKSNIGPDGGGVEYELQQVPIEGSPGVFGQRVMWGSTLQGSARELLAVSDHSEDFAGAPSRDEAETWLKLILANGPLAASEVIAAAKAECIAEKTLRRAKEHLGVLVKKTGGTGAPWVWELPSTGGKGSHSEMAAFDSQPRKVVGDDTEAF